MCRRNNRNKRNKRRSSNKRRTKPQKFKNYKTVSINDGEKIRVRCVYDEDDEEEKQRDILENLENTTII